jgi:hypothetical protein
MKSKRKRGLFRPNRGKKKIRPSLSEACLIMTLILCQIFNKRFSGPNLLVKPSWSQSYSRCCDCVADT